MTAEAEADAVEELELELLLEALHRRHGHDLRGYARASLRRRLWRRARLEGLQTLSGLQERVLHDPAVLARLLADLSVSVTGLFRDPGFHAALRERVLPVLGTYPFARAWVAGCSTGEEVVSLAIALHEADLLPRTRIYATDVDPGVLARARGGAFPREKAEASADDYRLAGGRGALAAYRRGPRSAARRPCPPGEHRLFRLAA